MKIWTKTDGAYKEGKFLVVRRDGRVPHWPHFVLGARDPAAPNALRAYARSYKNHAGPAFDEEYYYSILSLAVDFEDYRIAHGDGDPDAPPHRKDDPAVISVMRGGDATIEVRCDKGNSAKAAPP